MKRFRMQLLMAFIVLVCGVSLMGLVYIVFNKPDVYINPGIVSAPSPVATPIQKVSMNYPPKHRHVYTQPATMPTYHATNSSMPAPSYHGLYLTSSADVHNVGGGMGGYEMTTTSHHPKSSQNVVYSTVNVTMPTTNFVAMASQRQVAQPEAQEAPQMARLASSSRKAPGPPNIDGPLPEDHQLVEHPIGDAIWPLLMMAIGYVAYRRTKKRKTRVTASLSGLEAECCAYQEIDSLAAISVVNLILAVQPVIDLCE